MTLKPEELAELKRIEAKALPPGSVPYADTMTVLCALPALIAAAEREARAKAAADTALGYMMSASVALGAGATKAQAIETLNNGMARIRASLAGDA